MGSLRMNEGNVPPFQISVFAGVYVELVGLVYSMFLGSHSTYFCMH